MKPTPIDVKRISHNPAIKSYVIGDSGLKLTALLRNGHALKLAHMGCDHSGAWASLWLETDTPFSNTAAWSKEFINFSRIAFSPDIADDIAKSLNKHDYKINSTESRVVIDAAPTEYMTYSIILSLTEQGVLMTITYSLG